ncbi:NIPSNAP family protein [Steroidobacter sp. S1-65]|uniref:NIPSNAP family protein n=1 Tax=Steroidobacter gossypii TaxID=2805490 RepID=A0ABS1X4F3_9GAMM|nr:NIPSNAP family protein [Steroidobacter gossypii]MBM0108116.1 NIPSNAP family protein [Steroidobacter gossypii]
MTTGCFRRAGLFRAILSMLAALLFAAVPPTASAAQPPEVIHQLRVYEIFENNKQAFHERFRHHAMRIMAKYDFKIVAMWETQLHGRTEFVYLLQWPDQITLQDRWAKFMADKEWAEIKKRTGAQHGKLVGDIEDRIMTVTDYSPSKVFQRPVQL